MKAISGAIDALRTGEGLKGQLLRGGVGSIAVKIGSTLINVLLAIVLARTLGVEGFGVYSFVFALITIMAIPAQMGLPNLVVRETAKAQANGDWALMKGLWRWSTLMALAMSIALMALGAAAAWIFAAQLPEGGLAVFYWGLVLVPLIALGNLRGAALRGLRHVVQGQLPEFILRPAFLIVLVLGMHFGLSAGTVTAFDAMLLHAIASLAAFAIGAWMLLRARPGELRDATGSETRSGAWLKSALPLGLVDGLNILSGTVGLLVAGAATGTENAGLYRIALIGSNIVGFVHIAFELAVSPYLARLSANSQFRQIKTLYFYFSCASIAFALSVVLIFWFFGEAILLVILGDQYIAAHEVLTIMAASGFVGVLAGPAAPLLAMSGYEKYVLRCAWVSTSILIVLTIPMTAAWGIAGAAWSSVIFRSIMTTLLLYYVNKYLKINPYGAIKYVMSGNES